MNRLGTSARLRGLSWGQRLLLAESLVMLAAASAAIKMLPFSRVVSLASRPAGPTRLGPGEESRLLTVSRRLIEAWARRLPWRTVCFQKGLALHWMLRRRGVPSLLHFGVRQRTGEDLAAHVWISLRGEGILGAAEAADFSCLGTYPAETA